METLRINEQNKIPPSEQIGEQLLQFLNKPENKHIFNGKNIEEVFSNSEQKKEFIKNLNQKDFFQLLNIINGFLRNKPQNDWKMDGHIVMLRNDMHPDTYLPPSQEDKTKLLQKVLETAKIMNQENQSMENIALLISASINAIHAYLDANGRTSRMFYILLTKNLDKKGKNELETVLSTYGRNKIDINPGIPKIKLKLNNLIKNKIDIQNPESNPENITDFWSMVPISKIKFHSNIPEQDKNLFLKACKYDPEYLFWSIFKYVKSNPHINIQNYIEKYPNNRTLILLDVFVRKLKSKQIKQILQNYRKIKKEYVEKLIDSIANPNKEEYLIEIDGQKITLKTYLENKIKDQQRENIQREDSEQRKKEQAEATKLRQERQEKKIKNRFINGEGDYRFFQPSEIKSIQDTEKTIANMIKVTNQDYSENQKIDILKKSLFALAGKINSNVSISQEQIDLYVENKKTELTRFVTQFQTISEIMNFIENSGNFKYKINTSKDPEIPYATQEYLDRDKDITRFLDELFSQSVYYISPSGLSKRIILFEIKSKNISNAIQPTMEQIFFNNEMVDYIDKKMISITDLVPEQRKFVFEITTPEFRQKFLEQKKLEHPTKSGVGAISDEEKTYINIPNGSTRHSGWIIVSVKNLKK